MTPDPLQRFSDGVVRLRPLDVGLASELFRPAELVIRVDRANTASAALAGRIGFAYSHRTTDVDDGEGELDWYVLTTPPRATLRTDRPRDTPG